MRWQDSQVTRALSFVASTITVGARLMRQALQIVPSMGTMASSLPRLRMWL